MTATIKDFRELSKEEFFRICEAREQVFVLEQKITLCAELDELDLSCLHIILKDDDGRLVAYARCYAEGGVAHIGRVLSTVRAKGYGAEVMRIAMQACRERLGCGHMVIHAQQQVIPFYEKLGFRVCSGIFDECGIPHKEMEIV